MNVETLSKLQKKKKKKKKKTDVANHQWHAFFCQPNLWRHHY
jgi:hypothetical protein